MASIYPRNGILYISWYDWLRGKSLNRSTKLKDNPKNRRQAKRLAEELEKQLKEKKEKYEKLKLKKAMISQCFVHFLRLNSDMDPKTIGEYKRFYKKFLNSFSPDSEVTEITKETAEDWIIELKKLPYQRNTQYNYVKVLKKFLNFLFEYNYIPTFTLNKGLVPKAEVKPIITFTLEDLQKLIDNLEKKNSNFKITFYMLAYTGLRPCDIVKIAVDDINFERKTFRFYSPKTKEYFEIPFHPDLLPHLTERVEEVKSGRVIHYKNYESIGRAFRRYLKQNGLTGKKYNLRTFRKTFISLCYESGIDLANVSKLVGHKNILTTQKYYNKIALTHQSNQLSKLSIPTKSSTQN